MKTINLLVNKVEIKPRPRKLKATWKIEMEPIIAIAEIDDELIDEIVRQIMEEKRDPVIQVNYTL